VGIRTIFQGKALLVRTRLSNMAIFVPRRTSPEEPKAYSWLSYRGRPSVSPGLGKDKTSGHGLAYKESINPEAGVFWTSELSKKSSGLGRFNIRSLNLRRLLRALQNHRQFLL